MHYSRFIYSALCQAQEEPKLDAVLNEQILMLPIGDGGTKRETTIFKPNGEGANRLTVADRPISAGQHSLPI